MNTEERTIYKERMDELHEEIIKSFGLFEDGFEMTIYGLEKDTPDFMTRMYLSCDIFMADKLAEQFKNIHDELKEIRSKFGEDDNAE